MKKALLGMAAALMRLVPAGASARGFGGRIVVGGPFVGGYWGGPYWGGYWGPYYGYGPYWGGYYAFPNSGEIKLDTKVKDAQVFINGAYAGTTQEDKKMHLRPGNYNIEIREGGRTQFSEKVYVAAGKALHLHPEL